MDMNNSVVMQAALHVHMHVSNTHMEKYVYVAGL